MSRCGAIKASGERCKAVAIRGSEWCPAHHPDHQERRKQAAKKGGKRGGRGRPQVELTGLVAENTDIRRRVISGDIPPGVGAVAIQSINAGIRAVKVGLEVQEVVELVGRIEELEKDVTRENGGRNSWRA